MSEIVWLASYPKSGNTWMRIFLTNYRRNAESPVNVNNIDSTPIASARHVFDDATGINSGDLTSDEIDFYRPQVYIHLANHSDETLFIKIHDAYVYLPDCRPLIPREPTQGAIYIIRNPLDVAVSYSNHNGKPVAWVIQRLNDDDQSLAKIELGEDEQLRQRLLTWSNHVKSWVEEPDFPLLLIRYEDMIEKPVETFTRVVRFIGEEEDAARIQRAIEFSRFEVVQKQEQEHGFEEKPTKSAAFFRKGKNGSWREALSEAQAKQLIDAHREVMRRFGYLTENDEIVY